MLGLITGGDAGTGTSSKKSGMVYEKKAGTPKLNHKAELEAQPQKGGGQNTTKKLKE